MKRNTALLKDRLRRAEKQNLMLKAALAGPVRIYLAQVEWLGIGGVVITVNANGEFIRVDRLPYPLRGIPV